VKRTSFSIAPAIALLLGLGIGYVDSRPTWDDTGITAGAVFLCAFVTAASSPRWAWLSGLAVGLPVLAFDAVLRGSYASAAAVGIGLVAAGIGYGAGKLRRTLNPNLHR
jgi:hypothetical protein